MVADLERTATAERADLFLNLSPDGEYATLWTLRALVRGVTLDPDQVEHTTGHPVSLLREWAERWKGARYGAWFTGARPGRSPAEHEAELMLVRDLNASARFVILSLGSPGNTAGAEAVLAWQSGIASSVDYTRGFPRYAPGASSAAELLARGEADAALIVADRVEEDLPEDAGMHLAKIPRIVIAPEVTTSGSLASVALACATTGIDTPGTVMRADGVSLPLRPALAASLPTDGELLRAILDRLEAVGRSPFHKAEGEGA
jgi:formylmethanofuran dehydrogenase subunit B